MGPRQGVAGQAADRLAPPLHQGLPFPHPPVLECRRVAQGNAAEESIYGVVRGPLRLVLGRLEERFHVALDRSAQLDRLAVHVQRVGYQGSQPLQRLPEGSARGGFGRITPEQRGELLARVGAGFERQISEQGEPFRGAESS